MRGGRGGLRVAHINMNNPLADCNHLLIKRCVHVSIYGQQVIQYGGLNRMHGAVHILQNKTQPVQ